MKHHEVFSYFKCYDGKCGSAFVVNFLGAITRRKFLFHFNADRSVSPDFGEEIVHTQYPELSEDYFNWIPILESVVEAQSKFTMVELGAGYGPKLVNACVAARCYHGNNFPCDLVGVEAEPTHFKWMKQNFVDNNIKPSRYLINCAVFDKKGSVNFQVGFPSYYGQCINEIDRSFRDRLKEAAFSFIPQLNNREITITDYWTGKSAVGTIREKYVPTVALSEILNPFGYIDLIDSDIQGMEARVFRSARKEIDAKVKRIYIGTHSLEIEGELRALFNKLGWKCIYDFPGMKKCDTPFGGVNFQDGVQVWLNQRLKT